MVVSTATKTVLAARRAVVNLLLSNGRHDCDNCEAEGACELQEAALRLGIEKPEFVLEREYPPRDESAPMIVRDLGRCITCGRCVTGCSDTVVHEVLGFAGRGARTLLVCDDDLPMGESSCVQCGECVQLCPTGALLDRKSLGEAKPGTADKVETTCPYCGVGCGLTLHVDRGKRRVVRVTGTEDHPVSRGTLCVKGRYGYDFIHSTERLRKPLVRGDDGTLGETNWDEAISLVAARIGRTVEEYGPDAVAGLSSAKCTNEENYLFQKLFRQVIGTNSVDHCARLCHSSTVTAMAAAIGSAAMTSDIASIASADVILVVGSDTSAAHPVIASSIRRAVRSGGTKLIVIDPRETELAGKADIYVRHRCGTDVAVINGLMHLIVQNGWEDRAFIEARCEGFDELREELVHYPPARVEEISGVPAALLAETASLFGQAATGAVYFAMGITQHTTGTDNVRSLVNLQLLRGNFGRPGGGLNPLRGQCNVQGACDMGALPDVLPGYARVTDNAVRARFERAWSTTLPARRGLTSMELTEAAARGDLRALYVMGENPCLSEPDIRRVKAGLSALDFLVVQDIFLTETAELADVVLPAACFAEKDGLFTNTERRVQKVRRALPPPGEAREDWQILRDIAVALGAAWTCDSIDDIQEEIQNLVPAYAGISRDRVGREGLQWPCPDPNHPGTPILHVDGFPRGRARMEAVSWRPPAEEPDEEYPFILTTGRLLPQFHTGTMTRRCAGIDDLAGPMVNLSQEDATDLEVADGDTLEIATRRGSILAPALVTPAIGRGTVYIPFHFREAAVNLLTNPALDEEAKIPEFKVCAARVRKASSPGVSENQKK
jgi:formate dehydrogenase major subunit